MASISQQLAKQLHNQRNLFLFKIVSYEVRQELMCDTLYKS